MAGLLDDLGMGAAVVAGYDIGSRIAQAVGRGFPGPGGRRSSWPRHFPAPGRRVLEPRGTAGVLVPALPPARRWPEELLDGRPEARCAPTCAHFWTHWSGPAFTPSEARLDHLTDRYGAPGAFTASIGWYRAGSGTVASALGEIPPPAARIDVPTTVLWPELDPLLPARVVPTGSTSGSARPRGCTRSRGWVTSRPSRLAPDAFTEAVSERR